MKAVRSGQTWDATSMMNRSEWGIVDDRCSQCSFQSLNDGFFHYWHV